MRVKFLATVGWEALIVGSNSRLQFTIGVKFTIGVRPAILRFSIDQITGNGLRPRRPRVQTSALICRFNLDVAKENRAACFRIDVGAPANINARISHLAESDTASLKNAHAAAVAEAGR